MSRRRELGSYAHSPIRMSMWTLMAEVDDTREETEEATMEEHPDAWEASMDVEEAAE